jgi:hypothetical protein
LIEVSQAAALWKKGWKEALLHACFSRMPSQGAFMSFGTVKGVRSPRASLPKERKVLFIFLERFQPARPFCSVFSAAKLHSTF